MRPGRTREALPTVIATCISARCPIRDAVASAAEGALANWNRPIEAIPIHLGLETRQLTVTGRSTTALFGYMRLRYSAASMATTLRSRVAAVGTHRMRFRRWSGANKTRSNKKGAADLDSGP